MVKHEPELRNRLVRLVRTARADSLRTAEFYGLLRMLRRKVRRLVTCTNLWWAWSGWNRRPADLIYLIHHPRALGQFRRIRLDRKPVSSANVPAKTSGRPRRARTDDLRIKSQPMHGGLEHQKSLLGRLRCSQ